MADVSEESARRPLYVSITKAVRTAENNPAYSSLLGEQSSRDAAQEAYEGQKGVDVVVEVVDHSAIQVFEKFFQCGPAGNSGFL